MRVTRAHTGNRRSHHALKEPRLSTCAKCGAQHLRHRMCPECGTYRGREVVDVAEKKAARMKRREERLKAMGADTTSQQEEETADMKTAKKAENNEARTSATKDKKEK